MSDTTFTYNGNHYRWMLRREDIDRVLHYTHWIPNTRGFTQRFFDENYPGESLGGFMAVFKAAGILLKDGLGSPFGGRCHWKLRHLYFTDKAHWAIEWDDTVTEDDRKFFYSGKRSDTGLGRGAIDIKGSDLIDAQGEVRPDAVTKIIEQLRPDSSQ